MSDASLAAARRDLDELGGRWPVVPPPVLAAARQALCADGGRQGAGSLITALAGVEALASSSAAGLRAYLLNAILCSDEHPCMQLAARQGPQAVPPALRRLLRDDLRAWQRVAHALAGLLGEEGDDARVAGAAAPAPEPLPWSCAADRAREAAELAASDDWGAGVDRVGGFVHRYGLGECQGVVAFRFLPGADGEGCLEPLEHMAPFEIDWLEGNAERIATVIDNTRNLLDGFPAHNTLIWGPRGCGKSSLIRGLVTRWWASGLRAVEVPPGSYEHLAALYRLVRARPERFLAVLDNVALDRADPATRMLSTALDGGLEQRPSNLVFYATSNFKDLVDRAGERPQGPPVTQADGAPDELRHSEAALGPRRGFDPQAFQRLDERRALDDRFALKVFMDLPTRSEYERMVLAYARRAGLDTPDEQLLADFQVWRMRHNHDLVGGRTARDFILARYPDHARAAVAAPPPVPGQGDA